MKVNESDIFKYVSVIGEIAPQVGKLLYMPWYLAAPRAIRLGIKGLRRGNQGAGCYLAGQGIGMLGGESAPVRAAATAVQGMVVSVRIAEDALEIKKASDELSSVFSKDEKPAVSSGYLNRFKVCVVSSCSKSLKALSLSAKISGLAFSLLMHTLDGWDVAFGNGVAVRESVENLPGNISEIVEKVGNPESALSQRLQENQESIDKVLKMTGLKWTSDKLLQFGTGISALKTAAEVVKTAAEVIQHSVVAAAVVTEEAVLGLAELGPIDPVIAPAVEDALVSLDSSPDEQPPEVDLKARFSVDAATLFAGNVDLEPPMDPVQRIEEKVAEVVAAVPSVIAQVPVEIVKTMAIGAAPVSPQIGWFESWFSGDSAGYDDGDGSLWSRDGDTLF